MSELSYRAAVAELEDIVRKMESDACDIDQLSHAPSSCLNIVRSVFSRPMRRWSVVLPNYARLFLNDAHLNIVFIRGNIHVSHVVRRT